MLRIQIQAGFGQHLFRRSFMPPPAIRFILACSFIFRIQAPESGRQGMPLLSGLRLFRLSAVRKGLIQKPVS